MPSWEYFYHDMEQRDHGRRWSIMGPLLRHIDRYVYHPQYMDDELIVDTQGTVLRTGDTEIPSWVVTLWREVRDVVNKYEDTLDTAEMVTSDNGPMWVEIDAVSDDFLDYLFDDTFPNFSAVYLTEMKGCIRQVEDIIAEEQERRQL